MATTTIGIINKLKLQIIMKELKDINFNGNIVLKDNRVKGAILPKTAAELERDITIQSDTIIEGAVYARKLELQQGDIDIQGAIYTQLEFHVNTAAGGKIVLHKTVASSDAIVSFAKDCQLIFLADVNGKQVKLSNAFVAGSIFADNINLENCVVLGGIFATQTAYIKNCVMGTFNIPDVTLQGTNYLLLPSAFTTQKIKTSPTTLLYNLSLADLGNLYRGLPQQESSGIIRMDLDADELRSDLSADNKQLLLLCYTVVGKVLATELLDTRKLQNHFIIGATSLHDQLFQEYDLGMDKDNQPCKVTPEKTADFFFRILKGTIEIQEIEGNFSIEEVAQKFL